MLSVLMKAYLQTVREHFITASDPSGPEDCRIRFMSLSKNNKIPDLHDLSIPFINLQARRTETVGIVLHDLHHLFFMDLHLLTPAVFVTFTAEHASAFLAFFIHRPSWS